MSNIKAEKGLDYTFDKTDLTFAFEQCLKAKNVADVSRILEEKRINKELLEIIEDCNLI